MTSALREAIAEIEKLPKEEQNAIAGRFLAEAADEQAWAGRFAATSDEHWDLLAAAVRREIAAGATVPLESVFPPRHSGS